MRIEYTPSYRRFFLGRHYFTWVYKLSYNDRILKRSEKVVCKMIMETNKLTVNDIRQMRDYLNSFLRDKESDKIILREIP